MKTTDTEKELTELVAVYPEKKRDKPLIATFHFYILREGLDVRGGKILRLKNKKLFVQLPQSVGYDSETDKPIYFPVLTFMDRAYHDAIRQEIIGKVIKEWKRLEAKKKTARQS
jgi:hypothetical protein